MIEDPTLPLGISGSSAATLFLALHDAMHRIARCKHQVVSAFIIDNSSFAKSNKVDQNGNMRRGFLFLPSGGDEPTGMPQTRDL